ncbi:FabD/lysophospholipase-like protein [Neoconidiobolus thromboides FSU 785]|nr:FabD/lysophospholipase-like protein [Neoconidiobolus thromboides FSU 785]
MFFKNNFRHIRNKSLVIGLACSSYYYYRNNFNTRKIYLEDLKDNKSKLKNDKGILEEYIEPIQKNILKEMPALDQVLPNFDSVTKEFNKILIDANQKLIENKEQLLDMEQKVTEILNYWPKDFNLDLKNILNSFLNQFIDIILNDVNVDQIIDISKDKTLNPEMDLIANVRNEHKINEDEKHFIKNRRQAIHRAFAKLINVDKDLINPLDIPTIAYAGSGGGYRAMITSLGSLKGIKQMGLWDCLTYVSGVSGSCWLIYQYYTVGNKNFDFIQSHLKHRLTVDPANFSTFFKMLQTDVSIPLLSALIRKYKSEVPLSLVDIFGTLLTSRLLVTDNGNVEESTLNRGYLKFSNQRNIVKEGKEPFPIYTAIRHDTELDYNNFQWFEFTPFEMGSFEFDLFIPVWGLGRKFESGKSITNESEVESGTYLGLFGSAFCATIAHIFDEINGNLPQSINQWYNDMLEDYYEEMLKIHPINPISFYNPFYKTKAKGSKSIDDEKMASLVKQEQLSFMDAGMDNNLPFYPLLTNARDVDVIIAVDASDDVKNTSWLNKASDYAKKINNQRWPVGFDPWQQEEDQNIYISKNIINNEELNITVVYIPLLKNKRYGDFDPSTAAFCSTFNFKYEPEEVDLLSGLAEYNLSENEDKIKKVLKEIWLHKKKKREGE